MSMRYKGGVISATPPTTSSSSAVGIWTLEQQLQAKGANAWPAQLFFNYWLSTLTPSAGSNTYGTGVAIDSSNNVYMVGPQGTNSYPVLAKYNGFGTLLWQKEIQVSAPARTCAVALDSSDQPHVFIGMSPTYTIKFDTSGNVLWQKSLTPAGGNSIYSTSAQYPSQSIVVDSSGNSYAGIYGQDSGGAYLINITKRNSSGVVQWSQYLSTPSVTPTYGIGLSLDASSNVVAAGSYRLGNDNAATVFAVNPSGTGLWRAYVQGLVCCGIYRPANFCGSVVDTSGNVYTVGTYIDWGLSYNAAIVCAFNSSGTRLWAQLIYPSATIWGVSITRDSSNNLYVSVTGYDGGYVVTLAKYNSSGTIQWQRSLKGPLIGCTQVQLYAGDISLINDSYISVAFSYNSSGSPAKSGTLQVPSDGSKTGTYSVGGRSYTYYASTFTTRTPPQITGGTTTVPMSAFSNTDATTTLTVANGSMTNDVTTIP